MPNLSQKWCVAAALASLSFLVLDATIALLAILVVVLLVCACQSPTPPPDGSRSRRRSARAATTEKKMVRNPRLSTGGGGAPAAPSEAPEAPPSAKAEELLFPRVHALLPVRFEDARQDASTNASPSPLLDGPLEAQYRERSREPDWRNHASHMRRVQESMADELTSRDPAIRPIGGKFGCKPSLGVL